MKKIKISLIAAISENNVIGNKGKIPWNIPEDLKRFREITRGHVVIMGRKTFESIGRILPDRINIVITKRVQSFNQLDDLIFVNSVREAIDFARTKEKTGIFIIGGGKIFEQTIEIADKLYLTIVKGNFEGDAFFPDYSEFKKVVYKKESKDKNYQYTFLDLEKNYEKS